MKKVILVVGAFLLSTFGLTSFAANDIVFEKNHKTIDLQKDGTFDQVNELLVRLVSEQGAKGIGQVPISYSESLQSIEVLEAYTLKPDGTRMDVAKDKIFTQAAPVAVSAPMFNDVKYKIIVFPEPLAGGKIYFRVRIKQTTPLFPNHTSHIESIADQYVTESFKMRVSAPLDMALKSDSREVAGGKLPDKDGRAHWEWTYSNKEPRRPEAFEVAAIHFGPFVAFSTFADWADLAKSYRDRAAKKSVVTPEIQALADELTKGVTDPKLQAQAIYHWSARNVRYVAVMLGLGGFVPRESSEILSTKYGDCKDHTVLLDALMRAKGIESTPVLISTLSNYKLPKIPVVGVFNHAITYLPKLDVYLDGTASFARFGNLPNVDSGKPALLINSGKLAATPSVVASEAIVADKIELTLDALGNIDGRTELALSRGWDTGLRSWLAAVPATDKDKVITNWLGGSSKNTGTFKSSEPNDLNVPLSFSAGYTMKDVVSMDSPGAFRIPAGLGYANIHTAVSTGDLTTATRKQAYACGSDTRTEDISLALPEGITVLSLPKNVSFQDKTITFSATYKQVGQKIIVQRKLIRNRAKAYCEPEQWEETIKARDVLAKDAKAQVLFR